MQRFGPVNETTAVVNRVTTYLLIVYTRAHCIEINHLCISAINYNRYIIAKNKIPSICVIIVVSGKGLLFCGAVYIPKLAAIGCTR